MTGHGTPTAQIPDAYTSRLNWRKSDKSDSLMQMVVEFLEYHAMQGVQHFYLGVDYKWGSRDMNMLQVKSITHFLL
jgi:hypothetical protein